MRVYGVQSDALIDVYIIEIFKIINISIISSTYHFFVLRILKISFLK